MLGALAAPLAGCGAGAGSAPAGTRLTLTEDFGSRGQRAFTAPKVAGQETVAAPEPEAAPRVMDLMEALKASVEAAKKSKPAAASAAKPAKQRARKAS